MVYNHYDCGCCFSISQQGQVSMSREHEKITDELIEKYSKILDDLTTDD